MKIRKNILSALCLLFISTNCLAGPSFQFLSFELAQNSSKALDKFDSSYHLGLGFGKLFEKGTIEINPLVIIDDNENTRLDGQAAVYKLHGYLIGIEYNKIINSLMTFGGGLYFEYANETFASNATKTTLKETEKQSYLASLQAKFFLPLFRPFFRIQFGSKVHDYSLTIGTNLINF